MNEENSNAPSSPAPAAAQPEAAAAPPAPAPRAPKKAKAKKPSGKKRGRPPGKKDAQPRKRAPAPEAATPKQPVENPFAAEPPEADDQANGDPELPESEPAAEPPPAAEPEIPVWEDEKRIAELEPLAGKMAWVLTKKLRGFVTDEPLKVAAKDFKRNARRPAAQVVLKHLGGESSTPEARLLFCVAIAVWGDSEVFKDEDEDDEPDKRAQPAAEAA